MTDLSLFIDSADAIAEIYESEAAWLAARLAGVGASEIAAVLGLSRYQSPMAVWSAKLGLTDPAPEAERLRWGKRLQRPIAEGFREETGRTLVDPGPYTLIRSRRYPWLLASPDYLVQKPGLAAPGVLEVKNVSAYSRANWADEPPVEYQLQVQAQLLVTGLQWGTLAALLGGDTLLWADLQPVPVALDWILEETARFWDRVVQGTPPRPLDGSEATTAALRRFYGTVTPEKRIPLDERAQHLDETIRAGEGLVDTYTEAVNAAKNELRALLGDAEAGELPSGAVWTHKVETRKGYTKTIEPWSGRVLRRRGA